MLELVPDPLLQAVESLIVVDGRFQVVHYPLSVLDISGN